MRRIKYDDGIYIVITGAMWDWYTNSNAGVYRNKPHTWPWNMRRKPKGKR